MVRVRTLINCVDMAKTTSTMTRGKHKKHSTHSPEGTPQTTTRNHRVAVSPLANNAPLL